jgi:hypothetical protein
MQQNIETMYFFVVVSVFLGKVSSVLQVGEARMAVLIHGDKCQCIDMVHRPIEHPEKKWQTLCGTRSCGPLEAQLRVPSLAPRQRYGGWWTTERCLAGAWV